MSIKEIAKQVGASPSTVSRVLNNPDYKCQTPGLRDKIWKAAIQQNYVPNEAARNLKTGTGNAESKVYYVNVLMTRMDSSQSDPFFTELLRVVESEIHKNMCILSKVWYMPEFSNDRKCKSLDLREMIRNMYAEVEGKCDGLVVIGRCNKNVLEILDTYYRAIVSVNRNSSTYEVDEILCDGYKIATLAVEYLISLGHKNIAYVGECHNESRYKGYLDTLQKHDIDIDPEYIINTKQTEANGFECMRRLIEEEIYPTGIYCGNDITAIGMLKYLNKYKNRYYTPSIIGSDDIDEAQNTQPMLSTVHLPKNEMGKFAMYLLLDRLKGGHSSIVRMSMDGRLMARGSCSPAGHSMWSDYNI